MIDNAYQHGEPTPSCGKIYLACAFGYHACHQGYSVRYFRASRLFEALTIAHGDGSYLTLMGQLAKIDILLIDDWELEKLTQSQRNDLLELMEHRQGMRSTVITSQLPIPRWHDFIGDPTLADAILDPGRTAPASSTWRVTRCERNMGH